MQILSRIGAVLIGVFAITGFSQLLAAPADDYAKSGQPAASKSSAANPVPILPTPARLAPPPKDAGPAPTALPLPRPERPVDPAAAKAAGSPADVPAAPAAPSKPHGIRFKFSSEPWKNVLAWFAAQADLSLVMENPPPGSFSYTDSREYTPTEAINLLNRVLAMKGFALVRYERMVILINMEDPIPPYLIQTVTEDELDNRGEFELVRVIFNLDKFKPEEAEVEAKKLLGPLGTVIALPKTRQLSITDTAGRLRAVRTMINRIEKPDGAGSGNFRTFELKYARSEDVLSIVRQLLDLPEDKLSAADGSIRIAVEPRTGRTLFVTGQPEKVARVADVVQLLDVPATGRVRNFQMSPENAQAAIDRIQAIWPTMRGNKLHVIMPPPEAPSSTPQPVPGTSPRPSDRALPQNPPSASPVKPLPPASRSTDVFLRGKASRTARIARSVAERRSADTFHSSTARRATHGRFVAQQPAAGSAAPLSPPVAAPSAAAAPPATEGREPPPVVVKVGPNGLTVISDDPAALDEFERLLGAVSSPQGAGPLVPVFYLKYAKAADVAETVERLFAGETSSSSSGGEGDSGGGATTSHTAATRHLATGPIKITPDPRLNALFIQANRSDLANIRQVLQMLDEEKSPEDVSIAPKPRMIPVLHMPAQDVADVLRDVYANRLVTTNGNNQGQGGGGNQGGGRGGRGGRGGQGGFGGPFGGMGGPFGGMGGPFGAMFGGGGNQAAANDPNRIAIGVESRTNCVVVTATDQMFEEIKQLVSQIDVAASEQASAVQVIALHKTSADAMGRALTALAGDGVQIMTSPEASQTSTSSQPAWMQRATQGRGGTGFGAQGGNFAGRGGFGGNGFGGGGFGGGGFGGGPGGGGFEQGGTGGGGRFMRMMQMLQGGPGGGGPGGGGPGGGFGGGAGRGG